MSVVVSTAVPRLWAHQVEAVAAASDAIARGGRTTIVAACGTGKTRIGGVVAAQLGSSRRALVVLPTIELLVQTIEAYRSVGDGPLGTVVAVCSDPTVAELEMLTGEPDVVVTTTASVLADATRVHGRVTVLSTYASVPVIAAAHTEQALPEWDLLVVDEAHRTTGKADGPWKMVHHDELVPARRRLYMTATPRVSRTSGEDVVSMDNTTIYGPVSYRLPFSKAIDMGLLADYRVVVPVVTDEEVHRLTHDESLAMRLGGASLPPATLAGQIAVLRTMSEYGVRRAISYHHRVADAALWARTLPATAGLLPGRPAALWAGHVSGVQAPHLRRRILERLADPGEETVVVANAKVLNEGIDVPVVDAVVFSRPRESAIDTIQAVGRALRTGGRSHKVATVVVPLLLSAGESPEAALEGSAWQPVWQVIRALRDHDDRLEEYLRVQRAVLGEGQMVETDSREVKLPPWLHIQGVDVPDDFAQAITIRAVRASTPSWDEFYGAVRAYAHIHGHPNMPTIWVSPGGLRLGQWISEQRKAYKGGWLDPRRQALLEDINIIWDVLEDIRATAYEHARRFYQRHGHLDIQQAHRTDDGYHLGQWLGWQRMAYKAGTLPADQVDALNAIGMIWDRELDAWQRGYAAACAYRDQHGHLDVPQTYTTEDGYNLGTWVGKQRADFKKGKGALTAEKITLLDEVGITWAPADQRWTDAYQHAAAYRERNGHLDVPGPFTSPDGFRLGQWIIRQRQGRNTGTLPADKVRALEDLGIVWNVADAKWQRGYAEATDYVDRNKDLRVHAQYVTPGGYNLGGWIADQRKARAVGRLPADRIAKLDAIGMYWKVPDDTWQTAYADLQSYRATYGNLDVPQDFVAQTGINLYAWIIAQRMRRNQGKLPEERIALLDQIGFPWDPDRERWMRRYTQVAAAMGEPKHPRNLTRGSGERTWLDNQAAAYRRDALDPERRRLLEELGVTSNQWQTVWRNNYEELVAFVKEEGHFRVPEDYLTVDGVKLATWKNTQRQRRKQGKLTDEEQRLLDKIGFPWDAYAEHWDLRYAEAVEFFQRTGHLNPRAGSKLAKWLDRQRANLAAGTLAASQRRQLAELDPNWAVHNG